MRERAYLQLQDPASRPLALGILSPCKITVKTARSAHAPRVALRASLDSDLPRQDHRRPSGGRGLRRGPAYHQRMSEGPAAIPAEMIGKLTEAAARIADRSIAERPAEAAAVKTTQAKALELLFGGSRIPGSEHRAVYVITMTGLFLPRGHGPGGTSTIQSKKVRTVVLDTGTLRAHDIATTDHDHPALLPQLGPVTILHIP
jgi:hypothetical protein